MDSTRKIQLKFCIRLLIFITLNNLAESTPVHKHQRNVVIRAKVGETVNISCYFEPRMLDHTNSQLKHKRNTKSMNNAYYGQTLYRTTQKGNLNEKNFFNSAKFNTLHEDTLVINDEPIQESNYEIDWFFLDSRGRMNIISYGEETTAEYKYKTYMKTSNVRPISVGRDLSYSSSALYSQSSRVDSNKARSTYYLSALIESEEDEGVYQCINPFKPNYVIQNTTVLITRNHSRRLQSHFCVLIISFLLITLGRRFYV